MREHFTRAWWQVFVGSTVVGAVVGLGIGVIVGAGIGGAAGSPTRSAATATGHTAGTPRTMSHQAADRSPCGGFCLSVYSQFLGTGATMSVLPEGGGAGAGSTLAVVAHGLRHAEGQFTISLLARVGQFCGIDQHDFFPPGKFLCKHESTFNVVEVAWSPNGNQSGLCVGVPVAGRDGESVVLRPCGADARTLWIANEFHPAGLPRGSGPACVLPGEFCPLVSGADFNFTKPFVLAVDNTSSSPADQLRIERLALVPGTAHDRAAIGQQEFSFTSEPSLLSGFEMKPGVSARRCH
jgi:hypothetical protein